MLKPRTKSLKNNQNPPNIDSKRSKKKSNSQIKAINHNQSNHHLLNRQ